MYLSLFAGVRTKPRIAPVTTTVFLNEEKNLTLDLYTLPFVNQYPSQSSCDSLSTVLVSGDAFVRNYHTVHIVFSHLYLFEWVLIGEVRFLDVTTIQIGMYDISCINASYF